MKFIIALSLCVFSISNVLAEKFEPAKVFNIFEPQLTTIVQYDDNIYTDESEVVSSFIYYLKPSIAFTIEKGTNRYGGSYILTSSVYSNNGGLRGDDDMIDHEFSLSAYNEYTSKHRTRLNFDYDNLHIRRGSGLTSGDPSLFPNPIDYGQLNTRFYYQFGGLHAKMRIGAGLAYYEKEHNFYARITKFSDYDKVTFSTDADYQWGDVTYLTFDISTAGINYKYREPGEPSKDNRDSRVLVGVTWRGAAKINGRARFGYQYRTFDDAGRDNFHNGTVDLMINWLPKQRDVYAFTLSRAAEDPGTEVGVDYIENFTGSVGWQHQWTHKIDSNMQFDYSNEDYIGADRQNKTTNINAELVYGFSRWLNLSAGLEHLVSSSNTSDYEYDQNIFTLSLKASL